MTEEQYVDYCLWHLDTHIPEYLVPSENIAAILIEPGLAPCDYAWNVHPKVMSNPF